MAATNLENVFDLIISGAGVRPLLVLSLVGPV